MKELKQYKVCFANCNYKNGYAFVEAHNQDEAVILAKAIRIKGDMDYTLDKVIELN